MNRTSLLLATTALLALVAVVVGLPRQKDTSHTVAKPGETPTGVVLPPVTAKDGALTLTGKLSGAYLMAGQSEAYAVLTARADQPREVKRVPVSLALVIDRSGSMRGQKLTDAKQAARLLVQRLGAEDRLPEAPVEVLRRQGDDVIVRATDLHGREVVAERSPLLGAGILVRPIRPQAEAATAEYGDLALTFALAYGGRQEIADAVRRLIGDRAKQGASIEEIVEGVTQEEIGRYLYTAELPDPDLIIRTSGESRLSGFLLWQSAYSEFVFVDVNWPAFRRVDFLRALRDFEGRNRRFGQ